MSEFVPLATAFVGLLTELANNNNNNNNNNQANYEQDLYYLKKDFEQQINQNQLEFDTKLKMICDENLQKSKEQEANFEKGLIGIQNEINILQKDNEELERQRKIDNERHEEKIKQLKKEFKMKHEMTNEKIKALQKDNDEIKKIVLEERNKPNQLKCENEKLINEIRESKEQSELKEQKYNQSLKELQSGYQKSLDEQNNEIIKKRNKIKKLEKENEKNLRDNKIEIENKKKEYDESIQLAKKQYEEYEAKKKQEEEEKQKEENEQKQKDENNKKISEQKFQEISQIKINQFKDKLKKIILEKNFFDEVLNKYDLKEISTIINKIIGAINLKEVFDVKTKNFLNLVETLKVNPEMNHLNILLLGPTGSGKSTLINVLLELEGEELAEVGDDNNPKTMDFHAYTSNKKKYLRCFDSRGIEKDRNYSLGEFIANSKKFIEKKLTENNPDEFIHIILYCFEGNRLTSEIRDSLYKLMDLYTDDTLPIILVHTRSTQGQEEDELIDIIKNKIKKEKRKIDIISICAQQDDDFPAFGIDELNSLMLSKVKESIKSACFSSVQNKVRDNFIKVNVDYKNKFREEFEMIINKEMKNIKLNSNISEQRKKYLKIFSKHIFEKVLFDNKRNLDSNCKKALENYLNYFFKWIITNSEEYMMDFISKNSHELISELLSVQHNINSQYDNKLKIQRNNEEWKKEMDNELRKELDNVILFNLMKEGSFFIYDEFNKMLLDNLENRYKLYLQEENQFITDVTKGKVEEILNNFISN